MRLPKVCCDIGAYESRFDPGRRTTERGRRKAELLLAQGERCDTCRQCEFFAEDGALTSRVFANYAECRVSGRVVRDERSVAEGWKAGRTRENEDLLTVRELLDTDPENR